MDLNVTSGRIASVHAALQEPAWAHNGARAETIITEAVATGWMPLYRTEDLIDALGCRAWVLDGTQTCATFGILTTPAFRRPRSRSNCVGGASQLRVEDCAALLTLMERCGLPIDPAPLIEALVPLVKRKPVVSKAELHVLWYAQERHRMDPVVFLATDGTTSGRRDPETVLLTGYRAQIAFRQDGQPCRLEISKPKRGRARVAA